MGAIWEDPDRGAVLVAVEISGNANRGDKFAVAAGIEDSAQEDNWNSTVFALLQLHDHLSRTLRSPLGLSCLHARLFGIACDDERLTWRLGAALVMSYAQLVDATTLGDNELRWLATEQFNAAVTEANEDECFALVLAAGLAIWRTLLPEVGPELIEATAAQLWSET